MDKVEISVNEATEYLRNLGFVIAPNAIRLGIQQRVYPFGDCIIGDRGKKTYHIYSKLLEQWAKERT